MISKYEKLRNVKVSSRLEQVIMKISFPKKYRSLNKTETTETKNLILETILDRTFGKY